MNETKGWSWRVVYPSSAVRNHYPVQTLLFSLTSESHPCTNTLASAITSLYSAFKSQACLLSDPFHICTACFGIFIKPALTSFVPFQNVHS